MTESGSPSQRSFRYRRRVEFAETDLAGIAHFSVFFRYMEEAEHAWWRAAGMSIAPRGEPGWARVAAALDYKAPLQFEDEFDVLVELADVGRRKLQYAVTFRRGDTLIARGTMTTVRVSHAGGGQLRSHDVPEGVVERLLAAASA